MNKKPKRELHVIRSDKSFKELVEFDSFLGRIRQKVKFKKTLVVIVEDKKYKVKMGKFGILEWDEIGRIPVIKGEHKRVYIDYTLYKF